MSQTVAVALTTAGSTLIAVAITGFVTLRINLNQINAQRAVSDGERLEQRTTNRRQIRRDAYVQFFNQYGLVERELDRCWHEETSAEQKSAATFQSAAKSEMEKLAQALNIVILEGPNGVGLAGLSLQTRLTLELATLAGLFNEPNRRNPLLLHSQDSFSKAALERGRVKQRMIEAAQTAMEQD